jgi:hypothetical protein
MTGRETWNRIFIDAADCRLKPMVMSEVSQKFWAARHELECTESSDLNRSGLHKFGYRRRAPVVALSQTGLATFEMSRSTSRSPQIFSHEPR